MSDLNILRVTASTDVQVFLDAIAAEFPKALQSGRESAAVAWAELQLRQRLPEVPEVLRQLEARFDQEADVVHLSKLTLDKVPPTPLRYQSVLKADVLSFDIRQLILASLLGKCYGSGHVRGGRILADIFPHPDFLSKSDSALGGEVEFDFHSDGVVHPDTMPECVVLHCLRNLTETPTLVSAVQASDLEPEVLRLLSAPVYTLYYDQVIEGAQRLEATPLIEQDSPTGNLLLHYYGLRKIVCSIDGVAGQKYRNAIDTLARVLRANARGVVLSPGDLLFINNTRVVHGRPPFLVTATTLEDRRWLRRVYVARSEERRSAVAVETTRILHSAYHQVKNGTGERD